MSSSVIRVRVADQAIDPAEALAFLAEPAHGAMDFFIGTVRNTHRGQQVTGVTYDVCMPLAQTVLEEVCAQALALWPQTRYTVAHFHGHLPVGGISVLIGVGAAHREEAFAACRHVIEDIKKRAPVWKFEHYADGNSGWLPGHSLVARGGGDRIGGIVLAGGRSSRMGRDKALLLHAGRPLVVHMSDLLRQAGCASVEIAGAVAGHEGIPDDVPHSGPAQAMRDLLRRFADRYERLVFVPVDMPLLAADALRHLIACGVSACFAGHPLPAVLKTGAIADPPFPSVQALLTAAGALSLPLPPLWAGSMANINTPAEWEALAS